MLQADSSAAGAEICALRNPTAVQQVPTLDAERRSVSVVRGAASGSSAAGVRKVCRKPALPPPDPRCRQAEPTCGTGRGQGSAAEGVE